MFVTWLHTEMGYTFNGEAPISGLTRCEELSLQLGFQIQQEQREQEQNSGKRRKYTDPPESLDSAMESFQQRKIDNNGSGA